MNETAKPRGTILVVDDEEFVRDSLVAILEAEGYRVAQADQAPAALARCAEDSFDLIISDLDMPGDSGIDLLTQLRGRGIETPFVVLTGVGKVSDAVAAMRAGAYDFIQKPLEPEGLVLLIDRALEHGHLVTEVDRLRTTVRELRAPGRMVGASPWFQELGNTLDQVAPSEAIVLVTGESGTGKELVANEVHQRSRRAQGPLVRVNCAAISETLFESEFFGHRRGAFTSAVADRAGRFAEADGGTLVLDEIGTLKPEMQAKLLRVLETGEYQVVGESRTHHTDVRVVAVTNEDLAARVADGQFRSDLFYRLNIFPIAVPPLRERREDIAVVARYFLERFGGPQATLSQEGADVLTSYDWPGNVRELRNVVERVCILAGGQSPPADLLRSTLETATSASSSATALEQDLSLRGRLDARERELVIEALGRTDGSRKDAAELLGIDPKNMSYYLRKHEITEEELGQRS